MVDIRVTGLVKSFDLEKRILDGLSFQVDSGERVGLLGRNGAGKTTVFRMLTGELEPDEGEVQIAAGRRVGLISQIPVYPEGYTVEDVLQTAFARMFRMKDEMDALALRMEQGDSGADTLRRYGELNAKFEGLGGWDTETAVNKVANGLSIPREMRQREFACLSGGEKTRVNLGRLILEDTDILLLDEPTNHLDLQATEWLEGYLRRFRGTVLTISHDRYFLDRVVGRIFAFEGDGKLQQYEGGFTDYQAAKAEREVKLAESAAENPASAKKSADKGNDAAETDSASRGNAKPREKKLKFSYKEQREWDTIEDDIAKLEEAVENLEKEIEASATNFTKLNELMKEKEDEIEDGKLDTAKVKAFRVPAGAAVEVYGTTLHYAPCQTEKTGFRVAVVLPKGTNTEKPAFEPQSEEETWMTARNKWLLAHPDSSEAKTGAHIGLTGKNIDITEN